MSLTNPDKVVTEERLAEFYTQILPYLSTVAQNEYSTTEKVVGTWTDGKPIYQKTITGTLTNTSAQGTAAQAYYSVGASVKEYISVQARIKNTSTNADMILPLASKSGNNIIWIFCMPFTNSASSNANTIRLDNAWIISGTHTVYITVQYTKTTD